MKAHGQAALDRPRFRVDGDRAQPGVDLQEAVVVDDDPSLFGAGQAILIEGAAPRGGSDPRKDGYATGH